MFSDLFPKNGKLKITEYDQSQLDTEIFGLKLRISSIIPGTLLKQNSVQQDDKIKSKSS